MHERHNDGEAGGKPSLRAREVIWGKSHPFPEAAERSATLVRTRSLAEYRLPPRLLQLGTSATNTAGHTRCRLIVERLVVPQEPIEPRPQVRILVAVPLG